MIAARILCSNVAALRAQGVGLAEAAGFETDVRLLQMRPFWKHLAPAFWVKPSWAVNGLAMAGPLPPVIIGSGGAGARVAATLRQPGVRIVSVQHPRMPLSKFDLVLAARHDGIAGGNVIVTRTALHRVTPARLLAEAGYWRQRFAAAPRPLVAVLIGGANGRYRFDARIAAALAAQLADMIERDKVGLVLTPSRRTGPDILRILKSALEPRGAWIWDGTGENPYFGMLALADAIIVTADSVSMVSEAAATSAPLLLARLPGRSRRIDMFMNALVQDGRARDFTGRLELWDAAPLDDTEAAALEMRRRLGL